MLPAHRFFQLGIAMIYAVADTLKKRIVVCQQRNPYRQKKDSLKYRQKQTDNTKEDKKPTQCLSYNLFSAMVVQKVF